MASKDKDKEQQDSNITIFLFEDQVGAENFLDTVMKWQEKGLFEVIDSVIAVRGAGSDVAVHNGDFAKLRGRHQLHQGGQ